MDARADIYGLGCSLYFLLTGHPPFVGGTLPQRLIMHQTQEPPSIHLDRPDAPADLVAICQTMLAKRPEHRYQSAVEAADALAQWLRGQAEKGTGTFCAQHPEGRSGKRCLSPFPSATEAVGEGEEGKEAREEHAIQRVPLPASLAPLSASGRSGKRRRSPLPSSGLVVAQEVTASFPAPMASGPRPAPPPVAERLPSAGPGVSDVPLRMAESSTAEVSLADTLTGAELPTKGPNGPRRGPPALPKGLPVAQALGKPRSGWNRIGCRTTAARRNRGTSQARQRRTLIWRPISPGGGAPPLGFGLRQPAEPRWPPRWPCSPGRWAG